MRTYRSVRLAPQNVIAVFIAAYLLAIAFGAGTGASAFDDEEGAPPEAGAPAGMMPGEPEAPSLEAPSSKAPSLQAPSLEALSPDAPSAEPRAPRTLDRGVFRPDLQDGLEGAMPPDGQDQVGLSPLDVPLPSPEDRPKVLGELYAQLGKAKDADAAAPIITNIEKIWRTTGSPTVDLLLERAQRFTNETDLELAGKILDATVAMAPDDAEAWYLRAKVHYLKGKYELALADLKRALKLDPQHYRALEDLGLVFEALGTKKEALEAYRHALQVNPFLDDAKEAVQFLSREVGSRNL
jgi:tetratricopeptide (TPR) repeat protein